MNIFNHNEKFNQNQMSSNDQLPLAKNGKNTNKNIDQLIKMITIKQPSYKSKENQLINQFMAYSQQLYRSMQAAIPQKSTIISSDNEKDLKGKQDHAICKNKIFKSTLDKLYQESQKQNQIVVSNNVAASFNTYLDDRKSQNKQQFVNYQTIKLNRQKIVKNMAIFEGNCEIPYLHSTDAISSLYSTKNDQTQTQTENQICQINPTLSTSALLNLVQIKLYYTNLSSLRSLGNGWPNLRIISACHCLLIDLQGLAGFPKIEQLYLAYNIISDLSGLSSLYKGIKCLDLQGNQIQQSQTIHIEMMIELMNSLVNCKIVYLNLLNNPIWQSLENRNRLISNFGVALFEYAELQYIQKDIYQIQRNLWEKQNQSQWDIQSYYKIQSSNSLIKELNQLMNQDQITPQDCLKIYLQRKKALAQQLQEDYIDLDQLDFVRYESLYLSDVEQDLNKKQVLFTHLYNFLPKNHSISTTFKKYIEKKFYEIEERRQQPQNREQQKSVSQMKKLNPLINPMRLTKISQSNKCPSTTSTNIYVKSIDGKPNKSLRRKKFTGVDFKKQVQDQTNEIDQKFSKTETFRIQKINHSQQKKTFHHVEPSKLIKQPSIKMKRNRLFEARDSIRKNGLDMQSVQPTTAAISQNKILPNIKKLSKICLDSFV